MFTHNGITVERTGEGRYQTTRGPEWGAFMQLLPGVFVLMQNSKGLRQVEAEEHMSAVGAFLDAESRKRAAGYTDEERILGVALAAASRLPPGVA